MTSLRGSTGRHGGALAALLLAGCDLLMPFAAHEGQGDARVDAAVDAAVAADLDGALPGDRSIEQPTVDGLTGIWVDDDWADLPADQQVEGLVMGTSAFGTIAQAVATVGAGETINVRQGLYAETVKLDKQGQSLVGHEDAAGRPVIDGDPDDDEIPDLGALVWIAAEGVSVSGLEVREGETGIYVTANGAHVSGNQIHDMYNQGGSAGVGVMVWGASDCVISNNEVHDNDRQGIFIGFGDSSQIATGNRLEQNRVYRNGLYRFPDGPNPDPYGIQLMWTDGTALLENAVFEHTAADAAGVYLYEAGVSHIRRNTIEANIRGIVVNDGSSGAIEDNDIASNGRGILVRAWSDVAPDASGNRFCGNAPFAIDNQAPLTVQATSCWWGADDGPSGAGTGSGDPVSSGVDFGGYLANKPGSGSCAAP